MLGPEVADFADRIENAEKALARARSPVANVQGLQAVADLYHQLNRRFSGFNEYIAKEAIAELQGRLGLRQEQLAQRAQAALDRCVLAIRRHHLLGPAAHRCLHRWHALGPPDQWAPTAPAAFADPKVPADASRAFFLRAERRLAQRPDDCELRLQVTAMLIATTDHVRAIEVARPLADDYDALLLRGVAWFGQKRYRKSMTALARAIKVDADRPEAYFTQGALLFSRRYESYGDHSELAATRRRTLMRTSFDHLAAALCQWREAVLPTPEGLLRQAASLAEEADRGLHGGTHWSWSSSQPRPPPYLPRQVLPARLAASVNDAVQPRSTCAQVLQRLAQAP